MKRKILWMALGIALVTQLTACDGGVAGLFTKTCKAPGCDETEIYEDGYCKYHYYQNAVDSAVKDFINK